MYQGGTTKQAGQSPWIILKVMSRTLNIIRDSTGSQCSSRRVGLMCLYRLVPVSSVLNSLRSIPVPVLRDHKGYCYGSLDVILLMH